MWCEQTRSLHPSGCGFQLQAQQRRAPAVLQSKKTLKVHTGKKKTKHLKQNKNRDATVETMVDGEQTDRNDTNERTGWC